MGGGCVIISGMLQLSGALINRPVMSLRSGAAIATTTSPIINPNNLKVEGFYCQSPSDKDPLVVLYQDIRDIIPQGIVVNDHDALTHPGELIRLKDIMELNFQLMGKPVVTVSRDKVGKVNDYAIETTTMYVQKLYVGQSLLKSLSSGSLSVERTQIVEITNRKIIIQDPLQPTKAGVPVTAQIAS
jgi:sporulation protein YlmC with PRC-barrel domain